MAGAWLLAALFGTIHLPIYDWNRVQCLLIIDLVHQMLSLTNTDNNASLIQQVTKCETSCL